MHQLRSQFLLSMIRDLEDHSDIAGSLLYDLSKAGEVHQSLASSTTFHQLDARIAACNRLIRHIASQMPELLELTYE